MTPVYIGLGSNWDDPERQLRQAVAALEHLPASHLLAVAPFYRSKPWGVLDQPDFLNTVVKLETELTPLELWEQLQRIEKNQLRVKQRRWGERTIDCDILLFGNLRLKSAQLTIPHLYLEEREFVLVPLADVEPTLILPSGQLLQTKLITFDRRDITRM